MWMARCAYVHDLAPPAEFRRLVDALWRGKACQHCFGHGRHALGHWVGSHPSLRACDTLAAPNAAPRPNFPLRLEVRVSGPARGGAAAPQELVAPRSRGRDRRRGGAESLNTRKDWSPREVAAAIADEAGRNNI